MTPNPIAAPLTRRATLRRAGLAASLPLLSMVAPRAWADKPSGRVDIEQIQISLLIGAGWGHGTLYFEGTHPFSIKGLGIGGLGVDKIEARGNVFHLAKLSDFPGTYGSVHTGAVATDVEYKGGIWMQNPAGVQLHLVPKRVGLALSFGADGVLIQLD